MDFMNAFYVDAAHLSVRLGGGTLINLLGRQVSSTLIAFLPTLGTLQPKSDYLRWMIHLAFFVANLSSIAFLFALRN
jgi:hypothetical protein